MDKTTYVINMMDGRIEYEHGNMVTFKDGALIIKKGSTIGIAYGPMAWRCIRPAKEGEGIDGQPI